MREEFQGGAGRVQGSHALDRVTGNSICHKTPSVRWGAERVRVGCSG